MAEAQSGAGSQEAIGRLLDDGLRLLAAGCTAQACSQFEQILALAPSHAEARVRLAAAYLAERDFERAVREAESVLAGAPNHVRALAIAAEGYAGVGEEARARAAADKACRAFHRQVKQGERPDSPRRRDELAVLVRALAKLSDDRALAALARRYVHGSPGPWDGVTLTRLGVAVWNVGRYLEARWLWRRAAQDVGLQHLTAVFLHALDLLEERAIPPFRLDYTLGFGEIPARGSGHGEPVGNIKAFALYTLWSDRSGSPREAALDLLGRAEGSWAEPFLFSFLCRPDMPDALKLRASGWLLERGFLKPNSSVMIHLEGELREVTINATERPASGPLPPPNADGDEPRSRRARGYLRVARDGKEQRGRQRERVRRARVNPNMSWEAALSTLPKAHLTSMARGFGLRGTSRLTKGALAAAVARWLARYWSDLVDVLGDEDKALLRWIAEQGGAVSLRHLLERVNKEPTRPARGEPAPFHLLRSDMRLQALGLLFTGRGEEPGPDEAGRARELAVIPRELREALVGKPRSGR